MSGSYEYLRGDEVVRVGVRHDGGAGYVVQVGDQALPVTASRLPDGRVAFELAGARYTADAAGIGRATQVRVCGPAAQTYTLPRYEGQATESAGSGAVEAPMTGTVLAVEVGIGDVVEADQTLLVLSAMKMEHKLRAGIAGVVRELAVEAGETVEQGVLLARVEPEAK